MDIFYSPDISGNTYTLGKAESRHCVKVLRLGEGRHVTLVDGRGGLYKAVISVPRSDACIVEVLEREIGYGKRGYSLHIGIALTKNLARFEWFLEKATEIGVDKITPILCQHSERKVLKKERLNKVIVSAMKQSCKAYLPVLCPIVHLGDFMQHPFDGRKYIAHCRDTNKSLLRDVVKKMESVLVLIGPEGDFSEEEIAVSFKSGFVPVSLGSSRLRTETAGVIACHTINLLNE